MNDKRETIVGYDSGDNGDYETIVTAYKENDVIYIDGIWQERVSVDPERKTK